MTSATSSQLSFDPGHSQSPSAQLGTDAEHICDFGQVVPAAAEGHQGLSRQEQRSHQPVGFILLLVRIIAQKKHAARREMNIGRDMAEPDVR